MRKFPIALEFEYAACLAAIWAGGAFGSTTAGTAGGCRFDSGSALQSPK